MGLRAVLSVGLAAALTAGFSSADASMGHQTAQLGGPIRQPPADPRPTPPADAVKPLPQVRARTVTTAEGRLRPAPGCSWVTDAQADTRVRCDWD